MFHPFPVFDEFSSSISSIISAKKQKKVGQDLMNISDDRGEIV